MLKWYEYIPELLPFLVYAPTAFLATLNRLQGETDSVSRVAEAIGLNPWLLIGAFTVMAIVSILPLGYRVRVACMIPLMFYGLLSAYVNYTLSRQLINALFGAYYLVVIFIYPVVASILSLNVIRQERAERERLESKIDYLMKENDDHRRLLERYGGINGAEHAPH